MGNLEQLIVHHSYEGNLIPIDSDEAKSYLQKEKLRSYQKLKIQIRRLYLDGTRILPIALLDVYKPQDKPAIEIKKFDENIECKQIYFILITYILFLKLHNKQLTKMNDKQ